MKTSRRLEKTYRTQTPKVYAVVTPALENLVGKYRKINLGLLLGAVGLVCSLREPRQLVCGARCRAGERPRHSRRGWRNSNANHSTTPDRKFPDRADWWRARVSIAVWVRDALIALSPGDVSHFQQISFDLPVRRFHIFDRVTNHDHFRVVAGVAGLACGRSTGPEIRLGRRRRSAVGQTRA